MLRWILRTILVLLAILLLAGVAGAIWYAGDGKVQADVVERKCSFASGSVTVKVRVLGIERVQAIAAHECAMVPDKAYVEYFVRSGRTVIYDHQGGDCIWDTRAKGPC